MQDAKRSEAAQNPTNKAEIAARAAEAQKRFRARIEEHEAAQQAKAEQAKVAGDSAANHPPKSQPKPTEADHPPSTIAAHKTPTLQDIRQQALNQKAQKLQGERTGPSHSATDKATLFPLPGPKLAANLPKGLQNGLPEQRLPNAETAGIAGVPHSPELMALTYVHLPDIEAQVLTHKPVNSAAQLETAAIQQIYGFHDAAFAHWFSSTRAGAQSRMSTWVNNGFQGPKPENAGNFRSSTPLVNPHQTHPGTDRNRYAYNVELSADADAYYRRHSAEAVERWNLAVANAKAAQRLAQAQQHQREAQIRAQQESAATLKRIAEIEQAKKALQAKTILEQRQQKAALAPVLTTYPGKLNFANQFLMPPAPLPQSNQTSTISQLSIDHQTVMRQSQPEFNGVTRLPAAQPGPTSPPQRLTLPNGAIPAPQPYGVVPPSGLQRSVSPSPSTSGESKGMFDAHYAKAFYADVVQDAYKQHNFLNFIGGSLGGGITDAYLGLTGLAEKGVKDSLELAHQGQAEGGLSGNLKQLLGYGLTFIPSQLTEERAPMTLGGIAAMPVLGEAAATKLGQTILSNPLIKRAVLPAIETAGALFSGTQVYSGVTGVDPLSGKNLSEEERVSATGQGALGLLGTGLLLKDKAGELLNGAKAMSGNVGRFSRRLLGKPQETELQNGIRVIATEQLPAASRADRASEINLTGNDVDRNATILRSTSSETVGAKTGQSENAVQPIGKKPQTKIQLKSPELNQINLREQELVQALPKRQQVPVEIDPNLKGNTVRVHYTVDKNGQITDIQIRAGAEATPKDIQLHASTVKRMQQYSGLSRHVQQMKDSVRGWVSKNGAPPVGSTAWEAQLEVDKLPKIIAERAERLASGGLDEKTQSKLETELIELQQQVAHYQSKINTIDRNPGQGFVAAETEEGQYVYRGDMRNPKEIASQNGFQPWNKDGDISLSEHVFGIDDKTGEILNLEQRSQWVSTSTNEQAAAGFATDVDRTTFEDIYGYVYKIRRTSNGQDVNQILQSAPGHEDEVAFSGGISLENIIHSRKILGEGPIDQEAAFLLDSHINFLLEP